MADGTLESPASPRASTRAATTSWRCPRPRSANEASGTSSATSTVFPAAGEIAQFDRSWCNRAGAEPIMGFCTPEQTETLLRAVPDVERRLVDDLAKRW